MAIKYASFKQFDLNQRKPKVLFFGNGFFYEDKSWDNFIKANQDQKVNLPEEIEREIPNTIKAAILTSSNDDKRHLDYNKALENVDYNLNKDLLNNLLEIDFDAILTTNYTYQIENALDEKFVKTKSKTDKYVCCTVSEKTDEDYKYLIHTFNRLNKENKSFDIWHLHGEQRKTKSMVLTHEEYGELFGKISTFISKIKKTYIENNIITFESWIDYFLLGDVYILGYGCNFAEFDFWWLLQDVKNNKLLKVRLFVICQMTNIINPLLRL